jgi:hypothetical protein
MIPCIIGAAVGYGYYDIGIILTAANLAVLLVRERASADTSTAADINQDRLNT